ncbi:MAG: 3-isopropylmalate dehydratase [Burkholderiaceae bacterium]
MTPLPTDQNASRRVWRLGDQVDTDALAPGRYMHLAVADIAPHCLSSLRPEFAAEVTPGDVIVAGRNFGLGSSREQAAGVLRELGVAAVIAQSYGGVFWRNAINLGLLVLSCDCIEDIADGDRIGVDVAGNRLIRGDGSRRACEPIPDFLLEIVAAGGLLAHLRARIARGELAASARATRNGQGTAPGAG